MFCYIHLLYVSACINIHALSVNENEAFLIVLLVFLFYSSSLCQVVLLTKMRRKRRRKSDNDTTVTWRRLDRREGMKGEWRHDSSDDSPGLGLTMIKVK